MAGRVNVDNSTEKRVLIRWYFFLWEMSSITQLVSRVTIVQVTFCVRVGSVGGEGQTKKNRRPVSLG